jgi:hypothetical protein
MGTKAEPRWMEVPLRGFGPLSTLPFLSSYPGIGDLFAEEALLPVMILSRVSGLLFHYSSLHLCWYEYGWWARRRDLNAPTSALSAF